MRYIRYIKKISFVPIFFFIITIFLFSWLLNSMGCQPNTTSSKNQTYFPIQVGKAKAQVQVARTEYEQQRGLMYRYSLPENSGMLFIYKQPRILSFWMKNTFIPLSIAFIRSDSTISEILDMAPDNHLPDFLLPRYVSKEKVQYALEMPQNWFQTQKIQVGDKIIFSHELRKIIYEYQSKE